LAGRTGRAPGSSVATGMQCARTFSIWDSETATLG
jgi:hypothetical protein